MRYYFDYTTQDCSLYDYRGEEFGNPKNAIEFAAAIVNNLKHSLSDDWNGWQVEVRSADGVKYQTLALDADLAAWLH